MVARNIGFTFPLKQLFGCKSLKNIVILLKTLPFIPLKQKLFDYLLHNKYINFLQTAKRPTNLFLCSKLSKEAFWIRLQHFLRVCFRKTVFQETMDRGKHIPMKYLGFMLLTQSVDNIVDPPVESENKMTYLFAKKKTRLKTCKLCVDLHKSCQPFSISF